MLHTQNVIIIIIKKIMWHKDDDEKWKRETIFVNTSHNALWSLIFTELDCQWWREDDPSWNTFLWVQWKSALQRPLCWRILGCLKKRTPPNKKKPKTKDQTTTDTVWHYSEKYPVHRRVTHTVSQPDWWSNWGIHFDTTAQNSKVCVFPSKLYVLFAWERLTYTLKPFVLAM